jgi:hypothetical protein
VKATALPLDALAALHGLPGGMVEYRFAPPRRWRWDLCWPDRHLLVAVEVNGGLWVRGRHSRAKGAEADYCKNAAGILLGWRVFWCSTEQLNSGLVWEWVRKAMESQTVEVLT